MSVGTIKTWLLCSVQGHTAECDLKALMVGLKSYRTSLGLLLSLSAGANIEFLIVFPPPQKPFWSTGTDFFFVQEMLQCVRFQYAALPVVNGIKCFYI